MSKPSTFHYRKAIKNYSLANSIVQSQALVNFGLHFEQQNKLDSARKYFIQAQNAVSVEEKPGVAVLATSSLARVEEVLGNQMIADSLKEIALIYKRKVDHGNSGFPGLINLGNNKRTERIVTESTEKWEAEFNALLVKQLETENKLKQSKIRLQQFGLIGSILIGLLLAFIAISSYRKNKKINLQKKSDTVILKRKGYAP